MLFRGCWQLRDDSFCRFRTTLSSASTPLATRDGQVGGCASSNTRQRARKRRMNVMQLFSIIMESRRVRCARAACLFYAIFRTHPLPLSLKERVDRSDRFLQVRATSCGFVPSSTLYDASLFHSTIYHPAALSYFSFIRRPL